MEKVLVIYWSSTGNTEMMAEAVAEGARAAGAEVLLTPVSKIKPQKAAEYSHIAFGCPSTGVEMLEEDEMAPFFSAMEPGLSGRRVALFGSYGWGDGQWMRDWEDRVRDAKAELLNDEGLITMDTPDDDALEACRELGKSLAAV